MCATAWLIGHVAHAITHLDGKPRNLEGRYAAPDNPFLQHGSSDLDLGLASRQAGNNNGNNGDKCECKTKCKNKHYVIDSNNCARCIRCADGMVSDARPNCKRCVKDDGQHDTDKKARREEREKKWPEKKKRMTKKFKEKAPERKKRNDERKTRRMSLCVPIAIMGMGPFHANMYMDGFFSEDYLKSGEILQYWPEALVIHEWELDEWDDADEESFYTGDFLDASVDNAKETWDLENLGEGLDQRGLDTSPVPVRGGIHRRHLEKRRWFRLVGEVVSSIVRASVKKLPEHIRRKFGGFFNNRGEAKLGKGETRARQGGAVKNMLEKGPLRWCLQKQTPMNHS